MHCHHKVLFYVLCIDFYSFTVSKSWIICFPFFVFPFRLFITFLFLTVLLKTISIFINCFGNSFWSRGEHASCDIGNLFFERGFVLPYQIFVSSFICQIWNRILLFFIEKSFIISDYFTSCMNFFLMEFQRQLFSSSIQILWNDGHSDKELSLLI